MLKKTALLAGLAILAGTMALAGAGPASACGGQNSICGLWGTPGGSDYTGLEESATAQQYFPRPQLSREQAVDIVTTFVKRVNPSLKVGQVQDQGSYFVVEVVTAEKRVIDRLAVDKATGRLRSLG